MNIFAGLHKLKFGFISSDDKCKSIIVFLFLTNAAPHFLKKLTPLSAFPGLFHFFMSGYTGSVRIGEENIFLPCFYLV